MNFFSPTTNDEDDVDERVLFPEKLTAAPPRFDEDGVPDVFDVAAQLNNEDDDDEADAVSLTTSYNLSVVEEESEAPLFEDEEAPPAAALFEEEELPPTPRREKATFQPDLSALKALVPQLDTGSVWFYPVPDCVSAHRPTAPPPLLSTKVVRLTAVSKLAQGVQRDIADFTLEAAGGLPFGRIYYQGQPTIAFAPYLAEDSISDGDGAYPSLRHLCRRIVLPPAAKTPVPLDVVFDGIREDCCPVNTRAALESLRARFSGTGFGWAHCFLPMEVAAKFRAFISSWCSESLSLDPALPYSLSQASHLQLIATFAALDPSDEDMTRLRAYLAPVRGHGMLFKLLRTRCGCEDCPDCDISPEIYAYYPGGSVFDEPDSDAHSLEGLNQLLVLCASTVCGGLDLACHTIGQAATIGPTEQGLHRIGVSQRSFKFFRVKLQITGRAHTRALGHHDTNV